MFEQRAHENNVLFALRWAARLASVVCLAIIFLFFVGEGFDTGSIAFREWIGLAFFPLGVLVGLVLAWREEIAGGIVAIASVIAFYLVYGLVLNGSLWQGWAFLPFLVPAALFVLYGFKSRATHH